MLARIKKYFQAQKRRAEMERQEQDLLWEGRELLRALGSAQVDQETPEQTRRNFVEIVVNPLRKQKAAQDARRAARAMEILIKDPATPRPNYREASLN